MNHFKQHNINWNVELLDNPTNHLQSPDTLKACFNSHGLYNNIQFVLRLSPKVHNKIAAMPEGITRYEFDAESLQAYSTYIHETLHWWQYCGSTIGLMLSLSYPSQTQANYAILKKYLERIGPKKSILKFVERYAAQGGSPKTPAGIANIIVNNHFDIEFFKLLISDPKQLTQKVVEHPFYESVGHSYHIAYGSIISLLAISLDESFQIFPDPNTWSERFEALRQQKVEGHYLGSKINVSPIGAFQLFEGQARFAQLQHLYFAFGGNFSWDDARSKGMLNGIYSEAFKTFLSLSELEWPPSINHPVVGLFLLICDIAMNPNAGFPSPINNFKTFIADVDPGYRFIFLCRTTAEKPHLAKAIVAYSKEEYDEVSEALTGPLQFAPPLRIAAIVSEWLDANANIKKLMNEYEKFSYSGGNLTLHLLFSHYLAFNKDKLARPEFFCWPGRWMSGDRVSLEIANLFDRHSAPFIDRPDDEGIYPRIMKGKHETSIQSSFNSFYAENVCYDLSRQWICTEGPFRYDYRWMTSNGTQSEIKDFADNHFEQIYGIRPDTFEIL